MSLEMCPFQKVALNMQKKSGLRVKLLAHARYICLSYRSLIQKELHQFMLFEELALCLTSRQFSTFPPPASLHISQSRSPL